MTLRALLCLLLAVPAWAGGVNLPPTERIDNVVWIYTDDVNPNNWPVMAGATYPNGNAITLGTTATSTPQLDTLAASGLRVPNFFVGPQCFVSLASIYTGRSPVAIHTATIDGQHSAGQPVIARELDRLRPDIWKIRIGKLGTVGYQGYCSGDNETECFRDSECSGAGGTCQTIWNGVNGEHWDDSRYTSGGNGGLANTTIARASWDGASSTETTDAANTVDFRMDIEADEFEAAWTASAGRARFVLWGINLPWENNVEAGIVPLQCTPPDPGCWQSLIEYSTETLIADVVDFIGPEEMERTCIFHFSDNGLYTSNGAGNANLEGQKFSITSGGTQVGLMVYGGCVGDDQRGSMVSRIYDGYDLYRATLEMQRAYDPPATLPSNGDPSLNGQALVNHHDPLRHELDGYCPSFGCRDQENGGYFWSTVGNSDVTTTVRFRYVNREGYAVLSTRPESQSYGEAREWVLHALPDETTDLSATLPEKKAELVAAAEAWAAADYDGTWVELGITHPGTATQNVATDFTLSVSQSPADSHEFPLRVPMVCDIDLDDTAGTFRRVHNFNLKNEWNYDGSFSGTPYEATTSFTFQDTGAHTVAYECWDAWDIEGGETISGTIAVTVNP